MAAKCSKRVRKLVESVVKLSSPAADACRSAHQREMHLGALVGAVADSWHSTAGGEARGGVLQGRGIT